MCEASCLNSAPAIGSLVQNIETGALGRVVAYTEEDSMLEVRVANEWVAAITGHAVFDPDPEWWCPLDVIDPTDRA